MAYREKVSVIASFDTKGNIRPIRVRISELALEIESAKLVDIIFNDKIFQCVVIDGNYRKPLTLCYKTSEGCWYTVY